MLKMKNTDTTIQVKGRHQPYQVRGWNAQHIAELEAEAEDVKRTLSKVSPEEYTPEDVATLQDFCSAAIIKADASTEKGREKIRAIRKKRETATDG